MIPVNEPLITETDRSYVDDCVRSGWISSSGPYIDRFESAWSGICDRRHGVAVANGTVALELAVRAVDLPAGSRIVMPSFTIMSCALAALKNGLQPVFVDCDPETWCMDLDEAEQVIDENTSAVMVVHIYGHPVNMDRVAALAEKHDLVVIEDAAEAHGAIYEGAGGARVCGSFGAVSTFSFYANKLVTTGEGGMVVTDDDDIAERCRYLRNLAFGSPRFVHEDLGYNFRLTNLQAALGVAQVERFDEIVAKKRTIGGLYDAMLRDVAGLQLPVEKPWARSNYWMYGVVLEDAVQMDAATFAARLAERGVQTRPFFFGLHEQPVLRKNGVVPEVSLPVTERIARRGLYLPSGLTLTESDVRSVAGAVKEAIAA